MNNWFLLAAIPVFGICVLVHEFGHFITAKWAGIRVEEFGLGFPPRIVGIRKRKGGGWEVIWFGGRRNAEDSYGSLKQSPFSGTSGGPSMVTASSSSLAGAALIPGQNAEADDDDHTIYSLNLLPIGGFVRMPGENGDVYDEEGTYDPKSFAAKSAGKRIIVLVAGVTMNVILAMVLFTIAYGLGEPTFPPVIGKVVPGTPAAQAGMLPGDTILSVNGQRVQQFSDLQDIVGKLIAGDKSSWTRFLSPLFFSTREASRLSRRWLMYASIHQPDRGQWGSRKRSSLSVRPSGKPRLRASLTPLL